MAQDIGHVDLFGALLHELGLTRQQFEIAERSRFELSPRSWFHERLAKLGYVPAAAVERLLAEKGAA